MFFDKWAQEVHSQCTGTVASSFHITLVFEKFGSQPWFNIQQGAQGKFALSAEENGNSLPVSKLCTYTILYSEAQKGTRRKTHFSLKGDLKIIQNVIQCQNLIL